MDRSSVFIQRQDEISVELRSADKEIKEIALAYLKDVLTIDLSR